MTIDALQTAQAEDAFLTGEAADLDGVRWLAAGDRFCLLELAQHMELGINLRAIQLANRILEEKLDGVIETLPMFVSVLVHYDSQEISPSNLKDRVVAIWREISSERDAVVPSRIIEVPACYLDPWTRECVEEYSRTIKPIGDDPTFVAQANGFDSAETFVRRHAFTQHWVGGVGFWPGLPDMMPIDPRCRHSVPKYDPPRVSTVPGAIGVGGGFTSIYPMDTPGGYHLIGRTPIPVFSLDQRLAPFQERATLFRPGDRIKFRPIDHDTFGEIEKAVQAGAYRFSISDVDLFSLVRYGAWADRVVKEETEWSLPW
jgi:KipI family sensor histidine kinase inhibitor